MQKSRSSEHVDDRRPTLLVTADDRTGALETGGACADLGFAVRCALQPAPDDDCIVVDIASRHCQPDDAKRRVAVAHRHEARWRCHKMDSALRGNWAHESAALLAAGHRIGVLASFPDAGRRCARGTVFIHDVPVADSASGHDPRKPVLSSRPAEHLAAAGCAPALARGDAVVLDANDNAELRAAARRCRDDNRVLVGTTGAVGAFAATLRAAGRPPLPPLPRPALIVCGSLHPLSREQIAALGVPVLAPHERGRALAALARGDDAVVATAAARAPVEDSAAEATASGLAGNVRDWLAAGSARSLIVVGGDTAAAILGNRALRVRGSIATALPLCTRDDDPLAIVTKGGGIGAPDTLARLLGNI